MGLPAIPGVMLLTILLKFGMDDVSDPECLTSYQLDCDRSFVVVIAFRCRKSVDRV